MIEARRPLDPDQVAGELDGLREDCRTHSAFGDSPDREDFYLLIEAILSLAQRIDDFEESFTVQCRRLRYETPLQ
jgi:hypothetical protein